MDWMHLAEDMDRGGILWVR